MTHLDAADPATNATVMASAGTGKTWLLVTRLVRLLLAGARADGILAITFTRKAAAEMQQRLIQRLHKMAVAGEEELVELLEQMGVEPGGSNLERARALYEELLHAPQGVRTSTFHAFCMEILQRFPLEAEVPPGFELLEGGAALQQEAWSALFAEATAEPDAPLAQALQSLFLHCGGLFNTRQALESFVQHRSDWWTFTAGHRDPVGYARHRLQQQLAIQPGEDPLERFLDGSCRTRLQEYAELLARHDTRTNIRLNQTLCSALELQDAQRQFREISTVFLTGSGEPRKCTPSAIRARKMGEAGQERFLQLHQEISTAIITTREQLAAHATLAISTAWYLAGQRLLEHFQKLKEQQRLLDFADLEWRTFRLLSSGDNAYWVQFKLDQRIEHLLVDEFQDTNHTQWQLLLPLLEEMAAGDPARPRSVFLVGDGKQSIYRFRRAEPRLFDTAHRWLSEHLQAGSYPMDRSWRSAPAVMEFLNRLFGEGPLRQQIAQFHPHDTHLRDLWGRVELLPLIRPQPDPSPAPQDELRNPLQQPRDTFIDQRHLQEGEQIAATIRRLVGQPVVIGSGDKTRPISHADIMILTARRTHLPPIEEALRRAGIPYQGADRGTLLENQEIQDMVALLEILIAPYNNLSLAVVLRSPLFACSDQDLITLAGQTRHSWWERLMALSSPPGTPLARARVLLEQWHTASDLLPVHDLLQRIYSEGDLLARYRAASPKHLQARVTANLERFLQLALEVDSGRYPSLTHFLSHLKGVREQQDAPDEAPATSGEPQVQLMTIHAAKGLEAPVVFLVDAASSGGRESSWRALVEWPADQAQPSHFLLKSSARPPDPVTARLLERQAGERQRESANLLYVALTRARQLLYISACAPTRDRSLGWYGEIMERFGISEQQAEQGVVLSESGSMPQAPPPGGAEEEPSAEPDPRLRRPLQLQQVEQEIAPSREIPSPHPASGGDEDGMLRGVIIHRMLELATGVERHPPENLPARLAAELEPPPGRELLQECLQEVQELLDDPGLRDLFDDTRYISCYNELPLLYELDGRTVHGVIDRLLLEQERVTLLDYKTHRNATPTNAAKIAAGYRRQMQLYADGLRRIWPDRELRCLLLFTACRKLCELPFSE